MAQITHRSRPVIDETQGGWIIHPGVIGRDIEIVKLANATRMRFKNLGRSGSTIRLDLTFVGTQNQWGTFRTRLENLYDGSVGDLDVPGSGTYQQCVFIGEPSIGAEKQLADNQKMWDISVELAMG